MVPVKCAFQGGGAKLVTMFAAAKAIQELEAEGYIQLVEVAGTSAGSIVASILSKRIQIGEALERFHRTGAQVVDSFSVKNNIFSNIYMFYKMVSGVSIFDKNLFLEFLKKNLNPTGGLDENPIKIPLHIMMTDLDKGAGYVWSSNSNTSISLDNAIFNSCAIPFFFKTFKSDSPWIDGGLLANLVDASVFSNMPGKIVAFSFLGSGVSSIRSLPDYVKSIISVSIDHNVNKNIKNIDDHGGTIIKLPNDINMFDFKKALSKSVDGNYIQKISDDVKREVKSYLKDNSRLNEASFNNINEARSRIVSLAKEVEKFKGISVFTNSVIQGIIDQNPVSVIRNATIFFGKSFDTNSALEKDTLIKQTTLRALRDSICAFRIGITKNELFNIGDQKSVIVYDKDNNVLDFHCQIIERIRDNKPEWHLAFYTHNPIPSSHGPLNVQVSTRHSGMMDGLKSVGGYEWMKSETCQHDNVDVQDFVFFYPQGKFKFYADDLSNHFNKISGSLYGGVDKFSADTNNWCKGNIMPSDRISIYKSKFYDSVWDYEAIGWTVVNVQASKSCGIFIGRE